MKRFLNLWREIACVFLLTVFLYSVSLWAKDTPESALGRFLFIFLGLLDIFLFCLLIRQLWRKKWRYAFAKVGQKLFQSVSRFLVRVFERLSKKLGIGLRGKKNILVGKIQISFDERIFERQREHRKKPPKWKQLENDRDRLRYLYGNMVTHKIKSGSKIHCYDTPSEIKQNNAEGRFENELFELYIDARYDERAEIDDGKIEMLKEKSIEAYGKIK